MFSVNYLFFLPHTLDFYPKISVYGYETSVIQKKNVPLQLNMAIRIEHLTKTIGKQTILRDINLTIGDGEVVGLLGPNGAGKSTLMKILTGLWDFNEGEVTVYSIYSRETHRLPHEVAQYVGYLPENNPLYEDMYVREYLQFMGEMTMSQRTEVIDQIAEEVGLLPEIHKKIGQLSKGYRQRVGLAQALIGNPQLLILDEPTTGLDPNQLEDIRGLIKRLSIGRTIILSTHIMQEVEAMCSRVVILAKGEIREDTTNVTNLEQLFRDKTK